VQYFGPKFRPKNVLLHKSRRVPLFPKKRAKFHIFKSVNKMALSQFATLNDQENAKLLTDKDSENTKMSTKVWKTLFEEYLKQKQRNYPQNAIELAEILQL
jgi:hypothetical protein